MSDPSVRNPRSDASQPVAQPDSTSGPGIERSMLQHIIKRAAELSIAESESDELLSEDELIRIAVDLGLAPRHVKLAIYEQPTIESEPSIFSGMFGPSVVSASRLVPDDAEDTLRRIEDYLTTREYMQIVRRGKDRVLFMPAEDTISYLARGLLRPRSRFQLARSRRVAVTGRDTDENTTHVKIETDMTDQRRSAIQGAIVGGGVLGAALGGLGALFTVSSGLPETAAIAGGILAFGAGMSGSILAALKITGIKFRTRMQEAKLELDGLLDRAERGEALDPPPSPWRRRLQMTMFGERPDKQR